MENHWKLELVRSWMNYFDKHMKACEILNWTLKHIHVIIIIATTLSAYSLKITLWESTYACEITSMTLEAGNHDDHLYGINSGQA